MSKNELYEMASGGVVVQLGRFADDPAVFVRQRYSNEETIPPVISYPQLEKWHANDLGPNETVFLFKTMEEARRMASTLSTCSKYPVLNKSEPVTEESVAKRYVDGFKRPSATAHIFPDPTLSYDNHG